MTHNPLELMNTNTMRDLLVDLETALNADVFVYYGEMLSGVENETKRLIEELAHDTNKHEVLYVILTTPGGSLTPVQRMVDIFRRFYTEVNFIIPDYAYSAGTILCMSGDNILMNYYSVLGPIDPQVQNKDGNLVAALGYLDKINELLQKAKDNTLTQAEFLILKDFDLAELRSYEQAKELAVDLLKKWLTKYKFKDWTKHSNGTEVTLEQKQTRAVEIANLLSDNNKWKSHGRPINIDVIQQELHLKITDYGEDEHLNNAVDKYYTHLLEYIRNHNYKLFFQTRLFI